VELVTSCKLCGGGDLRLRYVLEREHVTVLECRTCGLKFVGDDLTDEDIAALYAVSSYADFFSGLEQRDEQKFARRLAEIDRLTQGRRPLRILDVGAGRGDFAAAAQEAGHEAVGVDISESAVAAARGRHPSLRFDLGSLDDIAASGEQFDVVTLLDVIEHVMHPHDILGAARRVVRSGGLLALATPNGDSLYDTIADVAYRTVRRTGDLMLSERYSRFHLQIWTKATLARLCREHDFDVVWTSKQRELTATPSRYVSQVGLRRLGAAVKAVDSLAETLWPFRNKLVLYARAA
jgi:2-polyprenyl-3-methyl-5-hydroxy-6-metoxy-1,4-benzoquinol methylase